MMEMVIDVVERINHFSHPSLLNRFVELVVSLSGFEVFRLSMNVFKVRSRNLVVKSKLFLAYFDIWMMSNLLAILLKLSFGSSSLKNLSNLPFTFCFNFDST